MEQMGERWRFWRDVLVFQLKVLLGNLRDFALIPISLAAAVIDLVSKGEREGSLFYRVLRWGAHSEEVLDAYSVVRDGTVRVNPNYTVDGVIARIEGVIVREYEKGGTAASIKAALDRVIDQVQQGTGGHRERAREALTKASEKLRDKLGKKDTSSSTETDAAVTIRPMAPSDAAVVAELAGELGYPNDEAAIKERIEKISASDLLLVANEASDRVVGFIQAHRLWIIEVGFRVDILGLVVSASARRTGIGCALLAAVEDWARKAGADAVVVRSNTKRIESHIFYPAMGYAPVKTQAVYEKPLFEKARSEASGLKS